MPITRGIATETRVPKRNGTEKGPTLTSGDETKQRRPRRCWGSTVKHSVLYLTPLGRGIQESITRFREKYFTLRAACGHARTTPDIDPA
jgi:hypothetical protein